MQDIHILAITNQEEVLSKTTYFEGIGYQVQVIGQTENLTIDARSIDDNGFVIGENTWVIVATK
jgi:tetrahydromethanopterin S-methyltransferase subunit F